MGEKEDLIEKVCQLSREEYLVSNYVIVMYSHILEDTIYIAPNESYRKVYGSNCYTVDEFDKIKHLNNEELIKIHDLKKDFQGIIVNPLVEERKKKYVYPKKNYNIKKELPKVEGTDFVFY